MAKRTPTKTTSTKSKAGCGCGGGVAEADDWAEIEAFHRDYGAGAQHGRVRRSGRAPAPLADEVARGCDWNAAVPECDETAPALVEDGYDLDTHGGGSLESVPGFQFLEPMVEGLGESSPVALPRDWTNMPTADAAHFENGGLETVCGRDDRQQVGTSAPPWRMICQLLVTLPNGARTRGTGWLISPRTVVTAGHCVYSRANGGWATSIEVIPGMNGRSRPFGSAVSNRFRSVSGWVTNADPRYDYGCILLSQDDRLGDRTGWFGFAALRDNQLNRVLTNNSGYPGDKAFATQWFNAGRITATERRRLSYMFDTAPGQSGSPAWVYRSKTGQRHAIGIHAYGGCANRATRITDEVFRHLSAWKAEGL